MSTPVRAQDREHFSLVQESLARDGLHVAMVARDRRRLQDYAGSLARALAGQDGLRVEAYNPTRLESLVVDLMLHRFDAALSDISSTSRIQLAGLHGTASRPGCVLFIPEAHALPRGEFRQLLRIAAGTRRNGLRLVALFDASSPACDERIAEMGTQIACWDLDDDADADADADAGYDRTAWQARRSHDADAASAGFADRARIPALPSLSLTSLSSIPRMSRRLAVNRGRWLAAAGVAAMLALLPAMFPLTGDESTLAPQDARTVTRSGLVELAGEPRQDFARAPATGDERTEAQYAQDTQEAHDAPSDTGIAVPDAGRINARAASSAITAEASSR